MPRAAGVALLLAAFASGCGGSGKVTQTVGQAGHWHLEFVETSRMKSWLNRVPALARWMDDPGFTGGRWWTVSPKGERTFLKLINYVSPDARDPDPLAFMAHAQANARSWGFDGFGGWSQMGPWAKMVDPPPAISECDFGGCWIWSGAFEEWVAPCQATQIDTMLAALRAHPNLAGLYWEYPGITSPRLLFVAYSALDPSTKSRQRLVTFMRDRCHGRLEELQRRLPHLKSFDELLATPLSTYDGIDEDAEAFLKLVYATYGAKVAAMLRDKAPELLNLGPIIDAGTPLSVVEAIAPYVDVLSFAVRTLDGRLSRRYFEEAFRRTGKPMFLTLWGQGLKISKAPAVETEAGQAIAYRRAVGAAAVLPFVTGFGYWGYRDAPDDALGLLDVSGLPRQLVTTTVKEANAELDKLHARGGPEFYADYFTENRLAGERPRCVVERLSRPVTVDGDLADWPGSGCWLGEVKLTRDLDPVVFCGVRIGWDAEGLVLGAEIRDDAVDLLDPRVYWRDADYLEIFLDGSGQRPREYGPGCFHLVFLPRGGGEDGAQALAMAMHHPGDGLPGTNYDFRSVTTGSSFFSGLRETRMTFAIGSLKRKSTYALHESSWKQEVRIPWSLLGVTPKPGVKLGFNFIAHRVAQRQEGAFWAAPRSEETVKSPALWGQLVLGGGGS